MPGVTEHRQLADHNQALIDLLSPRRDEFADWVATVAFYKAVHLVEAVFFHNSGEHSYSHDDRRRRLRENNRYLQLHRHYFILYEASVVARYLASSNLRGYRTFTDYMTWEDVQAQLLNHSLRQIEQSAERLLEQ